MFIKTKIIGQILGSIVTLNKSPYMNTLCARHLNYPSMPGTSQPVRLSPAYLLVPKIYFSCLCQFPPSSSSFPVMFYTIPYYLVKWATKGRHLMVVTQLPL